MNISKIGLGGSCHWCTEAVFQSLVGVEKVEQGWLAAEEANEFHEGVIVHFHQEQISLEILIDIHLHTHSSTSDHLMRKKYRSGVYTFSEEQKEEVIEILKILQKDFSEPLVTQAFTFMKFKSSEETFRNYYYKNPGKPFCKSYIDPKLKLVLERYASFVRIPE